jgi:hypothetical protein
LKKEAEVRIENNKLGINISMLGISPDQLSDFVVELGQGEEVQLLCPASEGRTCVYIGVSPEGKLTIEGGSSIVEKISGDSLRKKVQD